MSKKKNKNLTVKILALFISILLWSYVRTEINPDIVRQFKDIEVEVLNERVLNDSGLVLVDYEDTKISVKVSGKRKDINAIKREDIIAEVDLSGATEGTRKIPIDVRVPFTVELKDISERYVSFEIDSIVTEKRKVEINILKAGKDDIIKENTVSPSEIEVTGPSTYISRIAKVVVDVDIDKINQSNTIKLPIKIIDKNGEEIEGIKSNISTVEVSLSLLKTKEVNIKLNLLGQPANDYKIKSSQINPSKVTIIGKEEDIKNISELQTTDIDIDNLDKDKMVNLSFKLPKGIELYNKAKNVVLDIRIEANTIKEEIPEDTEIEENIEGAEDIETEQ